MDYRLSDTTDDDMEDQIHQLEQKAYGSVVLAFKAQSDVITKKMGSLITELREVLRVSDEEHRVLLSRVNADDLIRRISEWRKALSAPSPALQPLRHTSFSALKQGPLSAARGQNLKPSACTGFAGRGQVADQGLNEPIDVAHQDPLIGRKVWMRWPDNNNFYEAVITDFNPMDGCHALVYDIGTPIESWEWVDLTKIPPDDIRWKDEYTGVPHRDSGHYGSGCGKKALSEFQLLDTGILIYELEKVFFSASYVDPLEIVKAKKLLKEQEEALIDVIEMLMEVSKCESGNN